MRLSFFILFLTYFLFLFSQKTDTLTFYSDAFQKERTIYVKTSWSYKYQSKKVKSPLVIILDGQHDWFVNPILNNIQYLQYTHEVPSAIVVIIPLEDRVKECGLPRNEDTLALHHFITKELTYQIEAYNPSDFRLLMGHSFSASFTLYSYLLAPNFYSKVIAHTPLDRLEKLVKAFEERKDINMKNIYISIGGRNKSKDYYHRKQFDSLEIKYPTFFQGINVYKANNSTHNAVPITTTPEILSTIFHPFSFRLDNIAMVDEQYKLLNSPLKLKDELEKIRSKFYIEKTYYNIELAEINGIASRYLASNYFEYANSLYEIGIEFYPNFYEFYLSLAEINSENDEEKAKQYLKKGEGLLLEFEVEMEYQQEILEEIEKYKKEKGWE